MDVSNPILSAVILFIVFYLAIGIKVLPENQRLALFNRQRKFVKLMGHGIVLQFGRGSGKRIRVPVGTTGEPVTMVLGRFRVKKGKFFNLPVVLTDLANIGSTIRITGLLRIRFPA